MAKVSAENEALSLEVEKLKAEPAPAKGALKAVPKEADAINKTTETEEPPDRPGGNLPCPAETVYYSIVASYQFPVTSKGKDRKRNSGNRELGTGNQYYYVKS